MCMRLATSELMNLRPLGLIPLKRKYRLQFVLLPPDRVLLVRLRYPRVLLSVISTILICSVDLSRKVKWLVELLQAGVGALVIGNYTSYLWITFLLDILRAPSYAQRMDLRIRDLVRVSANPFGTVGVIVHVLEGEQSEVACKSVYSTTLYAVQFKNSVHWFTEDDLTVVFDD